MFVYGIINRELYYPIEKELLIMPSELSEKWIGVEEAADYLGVKPSTVREWIKKQTGIPAHKIGKQWKFKISDLEQWIKSGASANI